MPGLSRHMVLPSPECPIYPLPPPCCHALTRFAFLCQLGVSEFETYIRNNQESIPNYGERYRQGETISTAFVESTINHVVSRRFIKRQQTHWMLRGAHPLLQTRTKVLNDELEDVFRQWYSLFRVQAKAA